MIHIVMVEPEIPANTGNISRTCAVTGAKLHLVKPLGLDISEKAVKRAGLDYWDKLDIEIHESLDDYIEKYGLNNTYLATTKAKNRYSDVKYDFSEDIFLMFGKETKGLPEDLIKNNMEKAIRIPMGKGLRSLNLSNSVAIIVYEVLRQMDFRGFRRSFKLFLILQIPHIL